MRGWVLVDYLQSMWREAPRHRSTGNNPDALFFQRSYCTRVQAESAKRPLRRRTGVVEREELEGAHPHDVPCPPADKCERAIPLSHDARSEKHMCCEENRL